VPESDQSYPRAYLYRQIVRAKLYIDAHYADQLDVSRISQEAFFSQYHFIRLFKKTYGLTPHRYLTSVRLDAAMRRLQSGSSVTDVCFDVGFTSLGSFIGLFKRIVGCTPSAYRRLWRERQTGLASTPLKFIPGCFAEAKGWKKAISEKRTI
jgi:AraC-like DNA-binding protein